MSCVILSILIKFKPCTVVLHELTNLKYTNNYFNKAIFVGMFSQVLFKKPFLPLPFHI